MSAIHINKRILRLRKLVQGIASANVWSRADKACDKADVDSHDLQWLDRLLDAVERDDGAEIERLRAHWNVP